MSNHIPTRQEIYQTLQQTQKRRAEESVWWNKLKKLSKEDKVLEFYQEYAKYLEWNARQYMSEGTQAIYKMAIRAAEIIKEKTND